MLKKFGVKIQYLEEILTLPDTKDDPDTGGRNDLFFAGQMTGVEGYVESSASGMLAGINLAHVLNGEEVCLPGNQTVIGSMSYYITHADPRNFQPMNANFGIVHLDAAVKKKDRKNAYAPQSLEIIRKLKEDGRL